MAFGQIVVGPPGSGKSTYCHGMQQYLTALNRKVAVVNLDPANDLLPYECAVDIMDLVCLEEVMQETSLGPNGGKLSAPGFCDLNGLPTQFICNCFHEIWVSIFCHISAVSHSDLDANLSSIGWALTAFWLEAFFCLLYCHHQQI